MKSVYIETTVVGNIAGRIHSDPLIASRQTITRNWWSTALDRYDIFASELVIDECNDGDPTAAAERLLVLDGIRLIQSSTEAESLVEALIDGHAVPASEPRDASHIAIAATNGIEFLVSWNFKHILNPSTTRMIESICRDCGFEPPSLCTPEQLLEAYDDS
ncbi:MAG: type II toxin-antitoxin system VapC family toxin [Pirellulaceae bacterium]